MTTELRFSVYSQAAAMGGTFNICQCSIGIRIAAKVEIQISHSSIETGNLFGATPVLQHSPFPTGTHQCPANLVVIFPPVREGDLLDGPGWSATPLILILIAAYGNSLTHLQR